MKLTNTKARGLNCPNDKQQTLVWDSEIRGFGLRITSSGYKSWIAQGRVNGITRRVTLGSIDLLSANEARVRAQKKLLEMYDGIDPVKKKQKSKARTETLREVMEDYIQNKRTKHGSLKASSKRDIRRAVEKSFIDWADIPACEINRNTCITRFRELSKSAPTKANHAFRYLRALLNWAREKHVTNDGQYSILAINPVAQMFKNQGLATWNPEKPRITRIPKNKIGEVWDFLVEQPVDSFLRDTSRTSADLIAFMMLTGTRIGEASQLTWDCVNLDSDVPTVLFRDTKNHIPLTLPLSAQLKTLLEKRLKLRVNNYVFHSIASKKGFLTDPRSILKKVSSICETHIHPHALRRTFDDIALICKVDSDIRRQLLNHMANDVHGVSYTNNPDPSVLLPAMKKIGEWVEEQAIIFKGENIIFLQASN